MSARLDKSYQPNPLLGRWVAVRHGRDVLRGTVMDTVAGSRRLKRIRVQTPGALQGTVLMPGAYEFLEFIA